jgi:hypothetical protein
MPCVALHPPFEEAREAVQEVMAAAVVITSTRITNTRFIIVVFRMKKGTRQTVLPGPLDGRPVHGSRTTSTLIGIGKKFPVKVVQSKTFSPVYARTIREKPQV